MNQPTVLWRHKKTGALYEILDSVLDATNSTEGRTLVTYRSIEFGDRKKFAREITEFLDGRFEKIT